MTTENPTNALTDGKKPLNSVFRQMDVEHVKAVINRALEVRSQLSASASSALGASIRDSVRIDGFRDASKAPAHQLSNPLMRRILESKNDGLAGAVLRAWAESHPSLHNIVDKHLASLDTPMEHSNVTAQPQFNPAWSWEEWLKESEVIVRGQDDLDKDDVTLMLCYVSRSFLEPRPQNQEEHRIASPLFRKWLDKLGELPPDAPEWVDARRFISALAKIAMEKAAARVGNEAKALSSTVAEIIKEFGDELRYLELDIGSWPEYAVARYLDLELGALFEDSSARSTIVPEVLELVADLKDALVKYRTIRPQASVRSDELRRATERRDSEQNILDIVARWEQLIDVTETSDDEPTTPSVIDESPKETDDNEPDTVSGSQADGGASTLSTVSMAEYRALKADLAGLRQENSGLQSDKTLVGRENGRLKNELSLSRKAEESWRKAYVNAKQVGPAKEKPVSLNSVEEALALAGRKFPDELLFCLNSKSDKTTPFQKPTELFDVLAWLATEYHRRRTKPGKKPDFNNLVKEACPGWFYSPHQASVTKGEFPEWYTATTDDKTYELLSHIGKGKSFNPQWTIRIAFAWDDDLKKVIVGYIGPHQKNRRS